jgi:hypothetical protein
MQEKPRSWIVGFFSDWLSPPPPQPRGPCAQIFPPAARRGKLVALMPSGGAIPVGKPLAKPAEAGERSGQRNQPQRCPSQKLWDFFGSRGATPLAGGTVRRAATLAPRTKIPAPGADVPHPDVRPYVPQRLASSQRSDHGGEPGVLPP